MSMRTSWTALSDCSCVMKPYRNASYDMMGPKSEDGLAEENRLDFDQYHRGLTIERCLEACPLCGKPRSSTTKELQRVDPISTALLVPPDVSRTRSQNVNT